MTGQTTKVPRLLTAAALVCVLLATGSCASDDDDPAADVADIGGVETAEVVAYADDAASTYLRVTLEDGLSEGEVRSAVDGVKDHFDDTDADPGSVQVVFDAFRAGVYPRHVGVDDTDSDLERALWLREDGRASWFGPGPHFRPGTSLARAGTSTLALAPASDVAQLALDLEEAVPSGDDVRRSYAVGSPDGSMRVQWTNYPSDLDRDGLEAFAALQQRLPGTTGWYEDRGGAEPARVGVHVDPADLSVAELLDQGEGLLAGLDAQVDEVGWGPLRDETLGDLRSTVRRLGPDLDRLVAMPGVATVRSDRVEVTDVASVAAVRRLLPEESVAVVREPNDLIGFVPDEVVQVGPARSDRANRLLLELAEIDGLRQLSGVLVLESDVSDEALAQVMARLASDGVPDAGLAVLVGEAPILRVGDLPVAGTLTDGGLEPADGGRPPVAADLVDRIAAAWDAARAGQRAG